jgi:hypothetical protein
MRRILLPLLSAILLVHPAAGAADDEVKAILAKAVKAHGGEKALTKYKGSRSKLKGKLTLPGAGEVDFTQEVTVMQPDKFKEAMELEIGGNNVKVVTIANGDKYSIEAGGKDIAITDGIKAALKEAQHSMKMSRLASLLKEKAVEVSPLGEVKVEGAPAVGVRVSSKGQKDLNLYFDKKTGLLAKVERRGTDPMTGNEFTEERIIMEYNKPNKIGIPLPKKVVVKRDGKKFMEAEISESEQLEKVEASEFEK